MREKRLAVATLKIQPELSIHKKWKETTKKKNKACKRISLVVLKTEDPGGLYTIAKPIKEYLGEPKITESSNNLQVLKSNFTAQQKTIYKKEKSKRTKH